SAAPGETPAGSTGASSIDVRSLCANSPTTGMATSVHDRNHHNAGDLQPEVHTERKSMHESTASFSMHKRVNEGLLGDRSERCKCVVQKLVTEAIALLFVP
ncbi:MAG TPA: hypothetical protein PK555_05040, partial [Steroidobacteraceae bacterium]|nr:hypothetical protein [Steroidobacteraceae bacterium]